MPTQADDVLLLFCNTPDLACASTIAHDLVERRLAACVNILAPCQSVYRWQDKIETAEEIPIMIKTTAARYPELESALCGLHPYMVPEILACPIHQGLPAYLNWVAEETTAP
jgi:periplasmic divalent cation tolerance protein